MVERAVVFDHRKIRHGSEPCLIKLMHQVIERMKIGKQLLALAADGDFIGDSPEADGGMVVILHNELAHLLERILPRPRRIQEHRDKRDFRPDNHAGLIAQIVEISVVLIVRKADGIRAHLLDELHILLMLPFANRPSLIQPILMAGNTVQRIGPPVERKARVRMHFKSTHAKARTNRVELRAALQQLRASFVEIRILHTIPQMRVFQANGSRTLMNIRLRTGNAVIPTIIDFEEQRLPVARIRQIRFQCDIRRAVLEKRRHAQARRAVIIEVEMALRNRNEAHLPVQPAEKRKVRHLRVDRVV